MTGATPPGGGEQTQPMAAPPSLRKAPARDQDGPAATGGATVAGPYADVDTIDEPDAARAAQTGSAPDRGTVAETVTGPGRITPAVPRTGGGRLGAVPPPGSGGGRLGAVPPPASGGSALAWLWGEQGQPGEYLLASRSVTVGRDPGSDIVLHERTVSREHARFEYDGSQWWLLSAASAGPTWVNGRPLAPGQRLPVTDGDRLRFGYHTQLRLLVPGDRG